MSSNTLNNLTTLSNSPNTELNLSTSENINSIDLLREKLKKINWEFNELKVLKDNLNILSIDTLKGNETSVVLVVERLYNLIIKQNFLLHEFDNYSTTLISELNLKKILIENKNSLHKEINLKINSTYIEKIKKLESDLLDKSKEIENLKSKIKKVVYSPNPYLNPPAVNTNSSINISELEGDLRNTFKNDNIHYTTFSGKESEIILKDNYETISNIQGSLQLQLPLMDFDGEKTNGGNGNKDRYGHVTNISQISFTNSIDSPISKKMLPLNNNYDSNINLNLDLLSCPSDTSVILNPSSSTNLNLKSGLNGTIQVLNRSFSKIVGSFKGEDSKICKMTKSSAISETKSINLNDSRNSIKRAKTKELLLTKTKEYLLTGSLDISEKSLNNTGSCSLKSSTNTIRHKKFPETPKSTHSVNKTISNLNNHIRSISVTTPKSNTNISHKLCKQSIESEDKKKSTLQSSSKSIIIDLLNNNNNNLSKSVNSVKSVNSIKSSFSEKSGNSLRNSGARKSASISLAKSPTPTMTINLNQSNQSVQFSNEGSEKKLKTTDKILDKYHKILDNYNKNVVSSSLLDQPSQNIRQISKKKINVEKNEVKNNISSPGMKINSRIKKVITGSLVSGISASNQLK